MTELEYATQEYRERQLKESTLDKKHKRLLARIRSAEVNGYNMTYSELAMFAELYDNNLINGSFDIFRYGFFRGQLALKAEMRKVGVANV